MEEKTTNIKSRVLQIAEFKEVSKETFFEELHSSYGNFKGKSKETALNSTFIEDLYTKYPDISLEWLVLGRGEMTKKPTFGNNFSNESETSYQCKLCTEKDKTIDALQKTIDSQEELLSFYRRTATDRPNKKTG